MVERFYKIGEVAELLNIEQHTLRYLESSLRLKIPRDERGDRLYCESDLDTLKLVMQLRSKGLNTTAIKLALENSQESKETQEIALTTTHRYELNLVEVVALSQRILEQNDELLSQNRKLEERIARLEKKLDERNAERESKIDEFLSLWRGEQEGKGRSWLSWLRGK